MFIFAYYLESYMNINIRDWIIFESSIFNISDIDNYIDISMKMYLYAGIYSSNRHNVKT